MVRVRRCQIGVARSRIIIRAHVGSDGAACAQRGRGPVVRAAGSCGSARLVVLRMLLVRSFFFLRTRRVM